MGMDKITGKCLEEIPEKLPKLTLLDLSQCDRVGYYFVILLSSTLG